MILRYSKSDGTQVVIPLQDKPLTIGRSPDADITLEDVKTSRVHCCVAPEGKGYAAKDLDSKNGCYLNEERIVSTTLRVGDKLRVGDTVFHVEKGKDHVGSSTALHDVQQQMSGGKGYRTILKEIVGDA